MADHACVDETQIEAAHRLTTGVDRLRGQIIDLARQRAAGEIVAEGMRQILAGVADRELGRPRDRPSRSEEHTSELQSLMRISYAVFCLKKKKKKTHVTSKRII